jgi:hypothetical protein
MPVVTPNNNFLAGIDKQTNEATVATVADYTTPTYSGASIGHVFERRRIEITDASSVQGDTTKGPTSWASDISFPGFAAQLGRYLQSLWPTDSISGAGPTYTHAFSGFGGTQPWIAMYSEWPGAGAHEQIFGKGLCTGMSFTATADNTELVVSHQAVGQSIERITHTRGTEEAMANGFFTLQATGGKIELDYDTPNVNPASAATWIQSVTINATRTASPVPTADAVSISNFSAGRGEPGGTMQMLYNSWDAYNATVFGAVAGTTVSNTSVYGALELTFKHTVNAAWEFSLYMPRVIFDVAPVTPGTDGGPLTQSVTLQIEKPTTGDHIQPTLINGVTPAY